MIGVQVNLDSGPVESSANLNEIHDALHINFMRVSMMLSSAVPAVIAAWLFDYRYCVDIPCGGAWCDGLHLRASLWRLAILCSTSHLLVAKKPMHSLLTAVMQLC